jgi:hypothetical protein
LRSDVARDLSDGAHDFLRVVWPAIRPKVQGGELKPVEAVAPGELEADLDQLAGIDAWHLRHDRGVMRGIASRIQWLAPDEKVWRSFTIRMQRPNGARTEYEKRCEALDHANEGWLLPHLTVQAYAALPRRQGRLLAAAVVRTHELYGYARQRPERKWRRNPADGVLFTPWWWKELDAAGIQVGVVDADVPEYEQMADDDWGVPDLADPQDPWADITVARPPDWKAV